MNDQELAKVRADLDDVAAGRLPKNALLDELEARKAADIATARAMRFQEGLSLYQITQATGRSKEWLREYAGL